MVVRYMFQISDIHIKVENTVNIKASFIRLISDIKRMGGILVIVGDVFENKTYLTIDDIHIFYWMLEGLLASNITTIVIPGNHDFNINSTFSKSSVELLTKKYPNVVCLSDTQMYAYDNLHFYVFSPIDKQIPVHSVDKGSPQIIKIALLHEPVNTAVYDNGEVIDGNRFSPYDFRSFDYVMLGDIHKPQFLAHNMAYSGSFVQKNKGEGLDHGYVLWDLEQRTGEHVFIPLKEVFIKVVATGNDCKLPSVSEDQVIKYVSLHHRQCTSEYLTQLQANMKATYGFINCIVDKNVKHDADISRHTMDSMPKEKELQHVDLIRDMLVDEPDNVVNAVIDYHRQQIQSTTEINYTTYKLWYLCWSNVFCYGEDNYIDFRHFDKHLVLVNGKNKQGKSSIIDILLRILFNECERGYKEDIINKSKNKAYIKACFVIGADVYVIEQLIYTTAKVHRLYKNGTNITKASISDTYTYLRTEIGIGDYKDFLNMTTALQHRQFIVDIEKKSLLSLFTKILNIDKLRIIEDAVRHDMSVAKKLLNATATKIQSLQRLPKENALMKEKARVDAQVFECQQQVDKVQQLLQVLNHKFNPIHIPHDIEERIHNIESRIDTYGTFKARTVDIESASIAVGMLRTQLQVQKDQLRDLTHKHTRDRGLYSSTSTHASTSTHSCKYSYAYDKLTFSPDCSSCTKNKEAIASAVTSGIHDVEVVRICTDKVKALEASVKEAEAKLQQEKLYVRILEDYNNHEKLLELQRIKQKNEEITHHINEYSELIKNKKHLYQCAVAKQLDVMKTLEKYKVCKQQLDDLTIEHQRLEDKHTLLQLYHKCINHKTGIPTVLVHNLCKVVRTKCNEILNVVADFELDITYQKEFKFYTVDRGVSIPATMGSGYQKFLIDMIMRIILTKISVVSNPNIIFIDEGFGCLDKDNFIQVCGILDKLKLYFDAMVVITHIDELKAYTDETLNITHVDGFSSLKYGTLTSAELRIKTSDECEDNKKAVLQYKAQDMANTMVVIHDTGYFTCLCCNKDLKYKAGAVERHLSAKSLVAKHMRYHKKSIQ